MPLIPRDPQKRPSSNLTQDGPAENTPEPGADAATGPNHGGIVLGQGPCTCRIRAWKWDARTMALLCMGCGARHRDRFYFGDTRGGLRHRPFEDIVQILGLNNPTTTANQIVDTIRRLKMSADTIVQICDELKDHVSIDVVVATNNQVVDAVRELVKRVEDAERESHANSDEAKFFYERLQKQELNIGNEPKPSNYVWLSLESWNEVWDLLVAASSDISDAAADDDIWSKGWYERFGKISKELVLGGLLSQLHNAVQAKRSRTPAPRKPDYLNKTRATVRKVVMKVGIHNRIMTENEVKDFAFGTQDYLELLEFLRSAQIDTQIELPSGAVVLLCGD